MSIKNRGIQKINYGEIHRFYPLKFLYSKKNCDLGKMILDSRIVFSEKYQNEIMDTLGFSLARVIEKIQEDIKKNFGENNNITISMSNYEKYSKLDYAPIMLDSEDIRYKIEETEFSTRINCSNSELEELRQQILRVNKEEQMSAEIYGKKFVWLQDRFILLPLKLKLYNGEKVWLNAKLYYFANGMGILKLEFPIINIDIGAMERNNIDLFISEVINKWDNKNYASEGSMLNIANTYIKYLEEDIGVGVQLYGYGMDYISLIDFDGMPKQIDNISNEVQEDLYHIVASPVPEKKNVSHVKEAKKYLQEHSWGRDNVKYIVKTMGGCLSCVDHILLDTVYEDYKQRSDNNCFDKDDYIYFCRQIAGDIFTNVEFALLIIILKKMNYCNCYDDKVGNLKILSKIQKEYNENVLFINELQDECYGSVYEQVAFFENNMKYYLKQEIMEQKLIAIDTVLNEEKKEKEEKLQNFLSIGGFLLALLFGLPAIYDTLVIVRKVLGSIICDIPIITIENISIVMWLVLNGLLVGRIIKNAIDK